MDKHTCKLCFRRFSNGRALGGHMRSHVAPSLRPPTSVSLIQQHSSSVSLPTSSFSSFGLEEDLGVEEKGMVAGAGGGGPGCVGGFYALRENPRKSFKFVDPEFSAIDYSCFVFSASGNHNNNNNNSASVVVQDRESETESSVPPCSSSSSFRRRSRRRRRRSPLAPPPPPPASTEVEPVSSVSDTTSDEDVALWLMMLSRDIWSKTIDSPKHQEEEEEDGEEEDQELAVSSDEEEKVRRRSKKIGNGGVGGRSRFQCGTCKKVFRSYQALGGHRSSHKKIKTCIAPTNIEREDDDDDEDENEYDDNHGSHQIRRDEPGANAGDDGDPATERRVHECPFCFRLFSSGQAMGGHKRSHLISGSYPLPPPTLNSSADMVASHGRVKVGDSLIDLNLPAPLEDEEVELESSAISDAS